MVLRQRSASVAAEAAVPLRHNDGKLLAAIARRQIDVAALAAIAGQSGGATVAKGMAISVVHQLEMVDVGHDQRQRPAMPLDARPFALQTLHQRAAIRQARQRIHMGIFDQQVLQVFGPQGGPHAGANSKASKGLVT